MNWLRWVVVSGCLSVSLTAGAAEAASHVNKVKARSASATVASGSRSAAKASKPASVVHKTTRAAKSSRGAKRAASLAAVRHVEPARPSFGQLQGLHGGGDPLELKSSVALVVDQDTSEVLFSKNSSAVLPIASITKLMTGLVVLEAGQSMDDLITITQDDVDTEKGSRSRLAVGTQLTRGELMHLALMASENRAAHALGRSYTGGVQAAVEAMNRKAAMLGMKDTHYVEPTGLSSNNQSSAQDLARLVMEAHKVPMMRELSTSQEMQVPVGHRVVQFRNTNGLVRDPQWEIGLQKTGYISEAGRCLVMQAKLAGRKLIMVLLDSAGKYSRIADAERIRRWMTAAPHGEARHGSGAEV
jgi:D-alanyl-D-alanine endopeptidase (penicillin-binding protein 7)